MNTGFFLLLHSIDMYPLTNGFFMSRYFLLFTFYFLLFTFYFLLFTFYFLLAACRAMFIRIILWGDIHQKKSPITGDFSFL